MNPNSTFPFSPQLESGLPDPQRLADPVITVFWNIKPDLDDPMVGFRSVRVDGLLLNEKLSRLIKDFIVEVSRLVGAECAYDELAKEQSRVVVCGVAFFREVTEIDQSDRFLCAALQVLSNFILTMDAVFDAIVRVCSPNAVPIVFEMNEGLAGMIEAPDGLLKYDLDQAAGYYNPKRYASAKEISVAEVANVFRTRTVSIQSLGAKTEDKVKKLLDKHHLTFSDIALAYDE